MPAFLPYLLATAVMALSHFDIVRGGAPVVPVFAFTYATGCPMPVASYVPVPITPISPLGAAMTFTPAQLETPALSFTVKYTPAAATKQRTIAQLMSASTTTTMYTTAAITNTTAAATATGTATAVAANEHDTTITTTSTSTRTSTSSAAAITAAAAAVLLVVLVGVAIFLVKHNGGTAGTAIEKMSAAVQEHGAWEQLEGLLFFLWGFFGGAGRILSRYCPAIYAVIEKLVLDAADYVVKLLLKCGPGRRIFESFVTESLRRRWVGEQVWAFLATIRIDPEKSAQEVAAAIVRQAKDLRHPVRVVRYVFKVVRAFNGVFERGTVDGLAVQHFSELLCDARQQVQGGYLDASTETTMFKLLEIVKAKEGQNWALFVVAIYGACHAWEYMDIKEAALKTACAVYNHGATGVLTTLMRMSSSCYSMFWGGEEVSKQPIEEETRSTPRIVSLFVSFGARFL